MKGIDISHYQNGLDMQSIRDAGFDFAILKISEGDRLADDSAPAFYMRAREAGIPTGGYCYSHAASPEQARAEARFMIDRLRGFPMPLGLYMDVEEARQLALPEKELLETALAFCGEVRAAGYIPGLYGSEYSLWARLDPTRLDDDVLIWVAHYGKEPELPCDLWQSSDRGAVAGYAGFVDVDEARSTRFRKLAESGYAPLPSSAAKPDPVVMVLQLLMRDRGFWRGASDGLRTPAFLAALRQFTEAVEDG